MLPDVVVVGLLPGLGLGLEMLLLHPFCGVCCFLYTVVSGSEARRMLFIRTDAAVVVGECSPLPLVTDPPLRRAIAGPLESSSWNFLTSALTDVAEPFDSPVGVLRITLGVVGASGKRVSVATTVASSMPLELPSWMVATGFFTNVAVYVFSLSESEARRVGVTIWVGLWM